LDIIASREKSISFRLRLLGTRQASIASVLLSQENAVRQRTKLKVACRRGTECPKNSEINERSRPLVSFRVGARSRPAVFTVDIGGRASGPGHVLM